MKKVHFIFLFVLSLLLTSKAFSQVQDTLATDTAAVWDYQLGGQAKISWDSIKGYWTKNILPAILKRSHIDLSCRECPEVIMVVELTIDSTGHITKYKLDSGKKCGEKFPLGMEKQFLDYFLKTTFPPALCNKKIKTRLGSSLLCK
ncbi:MAG: hypothetical protein HY064_15400 [Bacteroidetes bacterium]|nr:hypothetical protein [Bacteroidota bacterium]